MAHAFTHICQYCRSPIPPNRVLGQSAVCAKCGMMTVNEPQKTSVQKYGKYVVSGLIVLGIGYVVRTYLTVSWSSAYAVGSMSKFEAEIVRNKCIETRDNDCVIAAYNRLSELSPEDAAIKANLAIRLTVAGRFEEADIMYRYAFSEGQENADFIANYAANLVGLGKFQDARAWYEKSLELSFNPEVAKKLEALQLF